MGAGGYELGLLMARYTIPRLIFAPIWGSLSDRIGSKPVLMLGVFGYDLAVVMFGLATSMWMLFSARILPEILSSATSPPGWLISATVQPKRSVVQGLGLLVQLGDWE